MKNQSHKDTIFKEKRIVSFLEKFYRRLAIPLEVLVFVSVFIGIAILLFVLVIINKHFPSSIDRFLTASLGLFFLGGALIVLLTHYPTKRRPEFSQRIILIVSALLFAIAGIVNIVMRSIFLAAISFIVTALILFFSFFAKKLSWGTEPKILFPKTIAKDYKTNLIRQEIIFTTMVIIGGMAWFLNLRTLGMILLWIGGFGILFSPFFALAVPPPGFISKTAKERKGIVDSDEKFLDAIFGTTFLGRTGTFVESVDNALFITNKRIFCITISGLIVSEEKSSTPFFKGLEFKYLEKKGNQLLQKTPQEVLNSHDFNFSLPFEKIKHISIISNIFFKFIGFNLVRVNIPSEGEYTFNIRYPDQLEKLTTLLEKILPGKITKTMLF